jgi:hypothetical protein
MDVGQAREEELLQKHRKARKELQGTYLFACEALFSDKPFIAVSIFVLSLKVWIAKLG